MTQKGSQDNNWTLKWKTRQHSTGLPEQEVQNINSQADFVGLQAFSHRPAHWCDSTGLQDGGQLPPTGQEESYSCVHWHNGTIKPQNLPHKRQFQTTSNQKKRKVEAKNRNLTCPRTLGNEVLTET